MITSNFDLHQGEKYIVETFVEIEEMDHDKQFCSRLLRMRQQATVSGKGLNRFVSLIFFSSPMHEVQGELLGSHFVRRPSVMRHAS